MKDIAYCDICKAHFDISKYGEGVCPKCGQKYAYDEGYFICLTDKQIEILKV